MKRTVAEATTLLDFLSTMFPDSSKTTLRQMLQAGRVRVSGAVEKDARRMLERDDLVDVSQKPNQRVLPLGLGILHEDDHVLVVFKDRGLLTVATERETKTTAQAFLNEYLAVAHAHPRLLPERVPDALGALELEKAAYEVMYELNNRPDWLPIPLAAFSYTETTEWRR